MLSGEGLLLFSFVTSIHLYALRFCFLDFVDLKTCFVRRSQTTKGIWMAKCAGIEPFTIAMDLEGTDGRERGEVLRFQC